jgi:hypothetical protein
MPWLKWPERGLLAGGFGALGWPVLQSQSPPAPNAVADGESQRIVRPLAATAGASDH